MRILAMTNLYPNPFQPHRATFNRHRLRLISERNPVRIIAPIAWTEELSAIWKGLPAIPKTRAVVHDGIHVEHPRYWFPPRLFRQFYGHFYESSVRRVFQRAISEFQPDIVFAPWAYPDGWAAVRLARKAALPVVIQVHGSDLLLLDKFPSRKARTIDAVRAADGVVAVSKDIANHLIRQGVSPKAVRVIYDGIDPIIFRPGSRDEARKKLQVHQDVPILLFIGNLVPVKAVDVLLDACKLLQEKGVTFQLNIIGQGPLRPALEQQAKRLGISDRVRFLGSMAQEKLAEWYRAADLFVLPSHSEGVPNVLLEASASRTPYVASNVGGIPEITDRSNGRLVPPNNPAALAEALHESLLQPIPMKMLEPRTRQEAVAELECFLEEVCSKSKSESNTRFMAPMSS